MENQITNIYQKEFFQNLGKLFATARKEAELDIDDISEMTGFSKIKVKSIEKGVEKRLLNIRLRSLLIFCQALNKKIIIRLE